MGKERVYKIRDFIVTDNPNQNQDTYVFTPEIHRKYEEMFYRVDKNDKSAVKELKELIVKYPQIPQFKNLLSVQYSNQGEKQKSTDVNNRMVEEHPDYLYGKIGLVTDFVENKQFERIPEILGKSLEISDLYPEKNVFHIKDVISFYYFAIIYLVHIEDVDAAEERLNILQELNTVFESEVSKMYTKINLMVFGLRMKRGLENFNKKREKARIVKVIPVKVVEETDEKPSFENELIEQLYCNGIKISHDLLKEILLLPRNTLISDLHKVVYDSIARLNYFSDNTKWEDETHEFLIHALFILTELKSFESIDVLFDILRQDEAYFHYWFGDILTEVIFQSLFVLGVDQLEKLKEFLFEPNHYSTARSFITEVVSQYAMHFPERRNEVLNWFKILIDEILAKKDDDTILDSDLNGFIVWNLLDINAVELDSNIKQLYDNELVSEDICGDYKAVNTQFKTGRKPKKTKVFDNIFSKYEHIVNTWRFNDESVDDEGKETEFKEQKSISFPFKSQNSKIGRNEPCPCGSGKKFKKCCLN